MDYLRCSSLFLGEIYPVGDLFLLVFVTYSNENPCAKYELLINDI